MFYDKFYELCRESNVSPTQVAKEINVRQSTVSMWKKQGTTPKTDTLLKLYEYFDVPMNFLLEKPPLDDLVLLMKYKSVILHSLTKNGYYDFDERIVWDISYSEYLWLIDRHIKSLSANENKELDIEYYEVPKGTSVRQKEKMVEGKAEIQFISKLGPMTDFEREALADENLNIWAQLENLSDWQVKEFENLSKVQQIEALRDIQNFIDFTLSKYKSNTAADTSDE